MVLKFYKFEIVKVELPNERCHFLMVEISRDYDALEAVTIFYMYAISVSCPGNNLIILWLIDNIVELYGEWVDVGVQNFEIH